MVGAICKALAPGTPGVDLLGIVDDLDAAYAGANIVINPLLAGTGLKTKTVEALGHAKALVTTACGAEGIEEEAGRAFLMADEPYAMAAHVCGLIADPEAAAALGARAFDFARTWNKAQLEVLARIGEQSEPANQPAAFGPV